MTKTELKILKDIYDHATFNNCSCGHNIDLVTKDSMFGGGKMEGVNGLAFIRENTRIFRQSWILAPLADLISKHDPTWRGAELLSGTMTTNAGDLRPDKDEEAEGIVSAILDRPDMGHAGNSMSEEPPL